MTKLKVQDHPGLVRDSRSSAIINIDEKAYKEYQNRKSMQTKVTSLEQEIKEVKTSINEIKNLILALSNKK